ncbi:MAG: hypothetical protein J6U17_00465 [Kiritimatiellae bacterium]|nr:hypothetical protein [Kiritimatiellia bacterium]
MKTTFISMAAALLAAVANASAPARQPAAKGPLIPAREWAMIRQIAVNYDLDEERTWLLAAIRRHENGRPGLEFGVGGPMDSGHPSHRYRDGYKSFYIQGMWAAGTVRKHYKGDLVEFGKRYNPPYPTQWSNGVSSLIRRLKSENGGKLPGPKPPKRKIDFP